MDSMFRATIEVNYDKSEFCFYYILYLANFFFQTGTYFSLKV